jgi:hypothetical protein
MHDVLLKELMNPFRALTPVSVLYVVGAGQLRSSEFN